MASQRQTSGVRGQPHRRLPEQTASATTRIPATAKSTRVPADRTVLANDVNGESRTGVCRAAGR